MSTPPLRELWDRVDAGPPPLAAVSSAATRVRWRRRTALVGAAAAVVTIAGLGLAGSHPGDGRVTDPAGALPAPPEGSRWVGTGRVVVAVPTSWTTGGTTCFEPFEDTVYVDTGAIADCARPVPPEDLDRASSLAVLEIAYAEAQLPRMVPVAGEAGRRVVELPGCERWLPGQCRHLFAVPAEDVVLAVSIAEPGDGDWEQIRDSLRILPDGLTTVPLDVSDRIRHTSGLGADAGYVDLLAATIDAAALEAEVVVVPRGPQAPAGSLLDISPSLGSVVEEGATVTITVAESGVS